MLTVKAPIVTGRLLAIEDGFAIVADEHGVQKYNLEWYRLSPEVEAQCGRELA